MFWCHMLRPRAHRSQQESTRLLGILASPSCPVRAAALQAPILSKALAHIKKHMQVRILLVPKELYSCLCTVAVICCSVVFITQTLCRRGH